MISRTSTTMMLHFMALGLTLLLVGNVLSLREFRSWSTRPVCEKAKSPNYPYAYAKYIGQRFESKGRVNTNNQDFRHECEVRGGKSKCHICEDIDCSSETGTCSLQLQGVNSSYMSYNVPTVTDSAWPIGGSHKKDYGGSNVTHFCVMLSGNNCTKPENEDFSECVTRCFGYGFNEQAVPYENNKLLVDTYPGMGKWDDDGKIDTWMYPRNCTDLLKYQGLNCTYASNTPDFNPQGFTLTLAGSSIGYKDGTGTSAKFNTPSDIAVSDDNIIYVADTGNHVIRKIDSTGDVTTLAGIAHSNGIQNGDCNQATFHAPSGLDVHTGSINGVIIHTIVVADTANHRIRKIEYIPSTGSCEVTCLTGLCGNNTLTEVDSKFRATPISGYADGTGDEARFSAPQGVAFMDDGYVAIADTGNYLIRWVNVSNGNTSTLAGRVIPGETGPDGKPLAGCTPPCMQGLQGYADGNLTHAQFYNPTDLTQGPNNTVWITDDNRIRMISLPGVETYLYGIGGEGRVATVAGTALQGITDGYSDIAQFFDPSGVFVTEDNIAYVVDSASCKVRRISPLPLVAEPITCTKVGVSLLRPSGCTSYDQPTDAIGRKVSRAEANVQYNLGYPYENDLDRGKFIKNCVGTPPRDELDKHFILRDGDNLVIDDDRTDINEDSEQGTAVIIWCPASCELSYGLVEGTTWYSEKSSVCGAAIHSGVMSNNGGYIQITFERYDYINYTGNATYYQGSTHNGVTSDYMPEDTIRVFSVQPLTEGMRIIHTVAGHPSAPLEGGCGFFDGQPPILSYFNKPSGIATNKLTSLTDTSYIFIADSGNHRIRAISAVCTQICENGGKCVGPDTCSCPSGWGGKDCTIPSCSTACGTNKVCVGPNLCACKPGFNGTNCDNAQCSQNCLNGGYCSAPDTCNCAPGWFDTNCTTPVCMNTCANGGNCTAPNTCACPSEWTGSDCRIPVCVQSCSNGGLCVAPNTCICPPNYIGYDCSTPVCTQGFFVPNPDDKYYRRFGASAVTYWETYRPCNLASWCNTTEELECDQLSMEYLVIEVPSGPEYRAKTGRKDRPIACMKIEVNIDYKMPFEILLADNTTTGVLRYSPVSPYETNSLNSWRGITAPEAGYTGPWTYEADRQVANVNWVNQSQGVYVCANKGNCTAPNICECAEGWAGFDCRTPICEQGYYFKNQDHYVSGEEVENELDIFVRFMQPDAPYNLTWPYSNPNFTTQWEFYENASYVRREYYAEGNTRYTGYADWDSGSRVVTYQGGYRCSIRSVTPWENISYVLSHPNYYSRYMNKTVQKDGLIYSHWEHMLWPPVTSKSRVLDKTYFNISYAYSNEGWRRQGIWNTTANNWEYGICIIEFYRNCTSKDKEFDLQSERYSLLVQDTDLAYRPRITYDDIRFHGVGRWLELGGECVDEVIRGCYNNGTCVAPNTCQCSDGWTGYDCTTPICDTPCKHHGNCTLPGICTCERGWRGDDCAIPICAQDCQNGGTCVAPDTCQCFQFENEFRDSRLGGGYPLFLDSRGFPAATGWTGFDCSVPICVQHDIGLKFITNKNTYDPDEGYLEFGGHGGDGKLTCTDAITGLTLPRCPQYDLYVIGNEGKTFQTGCGYDPLDTGCCLFGNWATHEVECYKCTKQSGIGGESVYTNNTFFCRGNFITVTGTKSEKTSGKFLSYLDSNQGFMMCGAHHSPRSQYDSSADPPDIPLYYKNRNERYSSYNDRENPLISNRFLCNIDYWTQGDYIDDAGLGDLQGVGSLFGLKHGRHLRINNPYTLNNDLKTGIPGEGIYSCYNRGSCIGPDTCTCTDGFEGDDCSTPLCRHLQPSGTVTACLNAGICSSKDQCDCIKVTSVLYTVHPEVNRGLTGWSGSDCTIPICTQGYFDPFCTDLPNNVASGGEGCYRCSNGGNCTAPDICTCAEGWTGFDCKTPVCSTVADPLTRMQLGTVYEDKVIAFEEDPCEMVALYGYHGWHGTKYTRGNCTKPNQCTCLCKNKYDPQACDKTGKSCNGPWQDQMAPLRNLLINRGVMFVFGSTDCAYGNEGNIDAMDQFVSCHLTVYFPGDSERDSVNMIVGIVFCAFIGSVIYFFVAARLRRRALQAKIERRRSKRSSEESLLQAGTFKS